MVNKYTKKNKFVKKYKIKNPSFFNYILEEKDNYDLIINFNEKNSISKKLFFKRNEKDYNSFAYTSLISHEKCNNYIASQITKLDVQLQNGSPPKYTILRLTLNINFLQILTGVKLLNFIVPIAES